MPILQSYWVKLDKNIALTSSFSQWSSNVVSQKVVVRMNKSISAHFGVFPSLLFVDIWIIHTGDVLSPGQNSEPVEIDHGTHEVSPDIQLLDQLHSPLDQLHGFLHIPPYKCADCLTRHPLETLFQLFLHLPGFLSHPLILLEILPLQRTLGALTPESSDLQQILSSGLSGTVAETSAQVAGQNLLALLDSHNGPNLVSQEVSHDPARNSVRNTGVINLRIGLVEPELSCVPVQILLATDLDIVTGDYPVDLLHLVTGGLQPVCHSHSILSDQRLYGFIVESLDVVRRVIQLENFSFSLLIDVRVDIGLELVQTHVNHEFDERKLIRNNLTLIYLPGSEQSPPLARRVPDSEGRTGGLVRLPVLGLAVLAAVKYILTNTTL